MHHRGQLMMLQRMIGLVPHLTRQMAGALGPGRASAPVAGGSMAAPRFYRRVAALPARAEAEQPSRMVQRASGRLRCPHPRADDRHRRAAGRGLPRLRPEFVASPKTSMYRIYRDIRFSENKAPYKTHVAANFPTPRPGQARRRGAVFSRVAGRGVGGRRLVRAADTPQLHAVREHIAGNSQTPADAGRIAGIPPRGGTARRRAAAARAARLSEGSPRRGVSEVPPVSRRPRVRAGLCDSPEVLRRPGRRLPAGRAAAAFSERAADQVDRG